MSGRDAGGELLRLDGVGVRFGGLKAVDSLSFAVGPSQVVGLIGPNGAGKTIPSVLGRWRFQPALPYRTRWPLQARS